MHSFLAPPALTLCLVAVLGGRLSADRWPQLPYLACVAAVRSALYLDFDNVFGGLLKLDPQLALTFAEKPGSWVDRLTSDAIGSGGRRWLVLRCYLNPGGWVPHPTNEGARLYFSRFRVPFTDAGFEVIDCPRLTHTKNGADIKMVLDAADALRSEVRYDEFVIASGDSDVTPLLVRIRAADRQVTVVSPSDSADVLGAVADRQIGGEELVQLLTDPSTTEDVTVIPDPLSTSEVAMGHGAVENPLSGADDPQAVFAALVRDQYAGSGRALNLTSLAHQARAVTGDAAATTKWFGHETFRRAVRSLNLPNARMSNVYLWDSHRHQPPADVESDGFAALAPDPVIRVTFDLRLPRLSSQSWPATYIALAAFVADHDFHLAEATRWARDRLVEGGLEVSRKAVTFVAQGAAYGGAPLYREPPPDAREIAEAFVANLLDRVSAADIDISDEEVDALRSWFGVPR